MRRYKIRLLVFSLDQSLINDNKEGDSLVRLAAYRQFCESLIVLIPSQKKHVVKRKRGVKIFPAFGRNQWERYWNLFYLAKKICQENKINLIITNDAVLGAIAICLKRYFNLKVQIGVFGLEITDTQWLEERPQNIILKWIQEWALRQADSLRADNHQDKKILTERYHIKPEKIIVVPVAPGITSQKRFLNAKRNPSLRYKLLGGKKYLILSVGALVKAKDYQTLIRAAQIVTRQVDKTMFVIAGEGVEREALEQMINGAKVESYIRLLGSVAYQQLPATYAASDLFVLSSIHEGFPRVLMEAALAGKPIITTAVSGSTDLIESNKDGLIVAIKNPQQLARAILKLLNNRSKALIFGKRIKVKAKRLLNFESRTNEIVNSWQNLIAPKFET